MTNQYQCELNKQYKLEFVNTLKTNVIGSKIDYETNQLLIENSVGNVG